MKQGKIKKIIKPEDLSKKVGRIEEKNPSFGGWLFRTKGTVAEPWTTAEEIFEDQELQEEIKKVRNIVNNPKLSQNKIR